MKYLVKFCSIVLAFLLLTATTFSQQKANKDSPCGDLPSILFKSNVTVLTTDAKSLLKTVADKLKENPESNLIIVGYTDGSKHGQALCLSRLGAIKRYVNEILSILKNRITVDMQTANGDMNSVDLRCSLNE